MRKVFFVMFFVAALGISIQAKAELINRGNGLIYDSDQNITWMQDANYAKTSGYNGNGSFPLGGAMMWGLAMVWAENLVYGGYDDWRLPTGAPNGNNGNTEGEMRHLYYNLGNTAGGPLINAGPFVNLELSRSYWTSTSYTVDPNLACNISFTNGNQNHDHKVSWLYAWAVRDGDVTPVPIPTAIWLLGSGLVGLIGIRRRFKK
jgi:hypothetical protein